jgi:protein-histidine pros-kinase
MPERYRTSHEGHRHNYVLNPVKKMMGEHLATAALRKDGTEFLMATALSATNTASGLLITCMVREVSSKNAEITED